MAIIRTAREILKNRGSLTEYNIKTKETLPKKNIAYSETCFFSVSFFSIIPFPLLFDSILLRILIFLGEDLSLKTIDH